MTTTPTSGAADLLDLIEAYAEARHRQGHSSYNAQTSAALQAVKAALAAGQATAAQAVVQDDLITIRKPTTSAEMLWLLKLAHLVISDVDKTLEETFAPAQPAAQQGVAYAALPDEGEPWRGHKFKEVQRGCWRCDCGKTIKEVTSDQSTPASGGNYPVMPKRYTVDDDGEELFTAEKMRAFADATHTLRASHGQAPAGAAHAADSVQEDLLDAAFEAVRKRLCGVQRYSFVLDDDGLVRRVRDRVGNWIEFDEAHALLDPMAVDAARKQGETQ